MADDLADPRPLKRPRSADDPIAPQPSTSASPSSNLSDLTRHEEFWFDDGSVVLVARNTGFRIFRSLLAAQSTIFADMLSSSSPSSQEMFEGCPVVHLSDSPQDVAHFLRILLPKSHRILYAREPRFSLRRISAIICLAHKYDVRDVFDQGVLALQEYFTSSFDTWESSNGMSITFKLEQAIGVINLATVVDKPELLPIAFYECALLGSTILHGFRREDRSIEYLSHSDIVRCINGRNKLAVKAVALVSEIFVMEPCPRCETRDRCRKALRTMLEEAIGSNEASDPDVLCGWKKAINDWAARYHLCGSCEKVAINRDIAARRRLWAELPEIFDIKVEGWNSSGEATEGGFTATVAATA